MKHGILTPVRKAALSNTPGRVINARSRRKDKDTRIRLDRLFRAVNPRICIKRRLGGIGDVLMTMPVTKAIKEIIPHCHLIYATDLKYSQEALGQIAEHNPYIDEIISAGLATNERYDYVVDITQTGLSKEKAGSIPPNRIDMFADAVGVDISADPVPIYIVTDKEKKWAKKKLNELVPDRTKKTKFIVIQARSNDARRTWPLSHVDELCSLLAEKDNTHVLLFDWGGSAKRWDKTTPNIHYCLDYNVIDTAAIVEQCDVVVCPDSAILHLAGALQKKIIAIFGPTPPDSRMNYYANATAVVKKLPCQFCLVGESSVLTTEGYKPLQKIQQGDIVKTAHGLYKTVTKLHKNKRAGRVLHEINHMGADTPIIGTAEHKILISRKTKTKKDIDICTDSNPEWVDIQDVCKGDYLCLPRNKKEEIGVETLRTRESGITRCWLFGLYLAEGHVQWHKSSYRREYSVRFTLGSHETGLIKRLKEVLEKEFKSKVFINDSKQDGSTQVWINSKEVATIFRSTFGKNTTAATKFVPNFIRNLKTNEIRAFLDGYFAGDGYTDNRDCKVYTTKSREIAYGVQELYTRFGILANVYHRIRDTNYKKNTDIYRIYVYDRKRYWTRWCADKDYIYTPVKKNTVSDRKDEFVYDITVENDPTFTVNNIAINDCWYTPKCMKSDSHKLECLMSITPVEVVEATMRKLAEPYKVATNITYGKDLTDKNQDNVILLRRTTNGLGDLLMTTPAIEALATKYPDMKIEVACQKKLWPVLQNNPHISKLLDANDSINPRRYFMVIDVSSPCASYEFSRVGSGRPVQKSRVEIFAEACSVRHLIKSLKPQYYMTDEETQWAKEFIHKVLPEGKKKPMIAVGLRSAEMYRNWPEEYFAKLFELLKPYVDVVLLDHSREHTFTKVVDACGFPLRKAISILSQCDGLITVDTCLLHFAAALDVPTITIFGPTDYKPRCKGYENVTVIKSDMECVPCWRNSQMPCKATGFIKGYSKCLSNVNAKEVANAAINKFTK